MGGGTGTEKWDELGREMESRTRNIIRQSNVQSTIRPYYLGRLRSFISMSPKVGNYVLIQTYTNMY